MPLTYLIGGVVIVLVFWIISTYNFFVTAKARIKASVQEIGNQLKRQMELIPNLESSAKGYLKHEKGIFEDLTSARRAISTAVKSTDVNKMARAAEQLGAVLPSLQIAVEDNPELKGSEVITKLMDELSATSDKVMYARRLVIDLTADYNIRRVTLPSSIVAGIFSFKELPGLITPEEGEHLSVSSSETKAPKINL